ncbi:hypothetical protein GJ496_002233 [Pomphorhynchus laevis]|nr:hypothetical protein GJ496_002233 [Pomphorhynchus laevis]
MRCSSHPDRMPTDLLLFWYSPRKIGCDEDRELAINLFKKGCDDLDEAGCCFNLAIYNFHGHELQQSPVGRHYLSRACDLNDSKSCVMLSELLVKDGKKDSLKYAKKACDLESSRGCFIAHKITQRLEMLTESAEFRKRYDTLKEFELNRPGLVMGSLHKIKQPKAKLDSKEYFLKSTDDNK